MARFALVAIGLLGFCLADPTKAADIKSFQRRDGAKIVAVVGEINVGDDARFKSEAAGAKNIIVALYSPGGNLFSALAIGEEIHSRGYYTVVLRDSFCASSCALTWLAGRERFMDRYSKIGFHAAYFVRAGKSHESGAANAVVGAYLARLGISDEAIFSMTATGPEGISWFHSEDFDKFGINVRIIPPQDDFAIINGYEKTRDVEASYRKLSAEISSEFASIYRDYTPNLAAKVEPVAPVGMEKFAAGDIEFNCNISCSFGFGLARHKMDYLFRSASWIELAQLVAQTKMNWDISYYYLGVAAERLGYNSSARKYLERSITLSQTVGGRCNYLVNNCNGHSLPREAREELQFIQQKSDYPTQNRARVDYIEATAEVSPCLISAANDLDDGRTEPSIIALAVQARCMGKVGDMRNILEAGWTNQARREMGELLERAFQKISIQTVLTLRGAQS